MLKAYKFRIYPSKSHITRLENVFSMCRHLYNWSLQERNDAWAKEKRNINYKQQQNQLPAMKKQRPWFSSVYSLVLQDVLHRLDKAYKNFYRRVKDSKCKEKGYPNFKKKGQWNSITYSQHRERPIKDKIRIPKIGDLKIVQHRYIPSNASIKTMTITKEGGKWFICFSVEIKEFPTEPKQDLSNSVGIDLGLIDFYYTSDGNQTKVPKFLKKNQKKLIRLQQRLSKAEKRSRKYYKLLFALQKVHYRIKCQRQDFLHKKANELLKYDLIIYENLNVKNMIRRPKPLKDQDGKYLPNRASIKAGLNRSISDASWRRFIEILKYKALFLGKKVLSVNPKMTSQKCSNCKNIVEKSLSVRTHECPECGFIANRDHNAAINILRLGLESLGLSLEAPTIALA